MTILDIEHAVILQILPAAVHDSLVKVRRKLEKETALASFVRLEVKYISVSLQKIAALIESRRRRGPVV